MNSCARCSAVQTEYRRLTALFIIQDKLLQTDNDVYYGMLRWVQCLLTNIYCSVQCKSQLMKTGPFISTTLIMHHNILC